MGKKEPLALLTDFERLIGLGPTGAARVLGMPYITYAQYRAGSRPFRRCNVLHVEAMTLLEPAVRADFIRRIMNADQP